MNFFGEFLAGGIGGAAGVFVGHPLDTVRVRQQMHGTGASSPYRSILSSATHIVRTEGAVSLFKGVTPPMAMVFVQSAVIFAVSGACDDYQSRALELAPGQDLPLWRLFLSGATAGVAVSVIVAPTDLVKIKLQMQDGTPEAIRDRARSSLHSYSGPLDCAAKLLRTQGPRGLFQGFLVTLHREWPSFGAYWWVYEAIKRKATNDKPREASVAVQLAAGGTAGVASWFITYPLDVLKTIVQKDGGSSISIARDLIQREGVSSLFRGCQATLLRAFPTNAVTFLIYEEVIKLWRKFVL
jgi:hypothetical protein